MGSKMGKGGGGDAYVAEGSAAVVGVPGCVAGSDGDGDGGGEDGEGDGQGEEEE